jgi:hypothetical protein
MKLFQAMFIRITEASVGLYKALRHPLQVRSVFDRKGSGALARSTKLLGSLPAQLFKVLVDRRVVCLALVLETLLPPLEPPLCGVVVVFQLESSAALKITSHFLPGKTIDLDTMN